MPKHDFSHRVALITGATSGIGRETARLLSHSGADVALVGRDEARLAAIADELSKDDRRAFAIRSDLLDDGEPSRIVEATIAGLGGLDVVVNAAGVIATGDLEATTLADLDRMMTINLRAPFETMKAALPHLAKRPGTVVNVSSVTGLRAFPGVLSYCVSKAALDQLTRCTALELADRGIRVNAVNPGVVVTGLHRSGGMDDDRYTAFLERSSSTTHPLGRVGKPEEVADLIAYLASDDAGWITGVTWSIDGGRAQTCAR